jgi:transposase InsO family protein
MNSDYFETKMLIPFEQMIFPRGRALHQKRLIVHLDNCSVHTSWASTDWLEEHGMRHMSHKSYSPDLALSDFCLFPTVKEKFERIHVADENQFLSLCKKI